MGLGWACVLVFKKKSSGNSDALQGLTSGDYKVGVCLEDTSEVWLRVGDWAPLRQHGGMLGRVWKGEAFPRGVGVHIVEGSPDSIC